MPSSDTRRRASVRSRREASRLRAPSSTRRVSSFCTARSCFSQPVVKRVSFSSTSPDTIGSEAYAARYRSTVRVVSPARSAA